MLHIVVLYPLCAHIPSAAPAGSSSTLGSIRLLDAHKYILSIGACEFEG